MKTRIDLHLHTRYSGDAIISPKLIVEQLHAHPFIKAVAITDHNTLQGYMEVRKLASSYQDIIIIPGIEMSTHQGDIIMLDVEEKPSYASTVWEVVDFAKARAGAIVIPHPYRINGIGDLAEKIPADAIEVINPTATLRENKMAQELAKVKNLPGIAGSDAHAPLHMWTAYTEVNADLDIDEILKAIKKGRVKPVLSDAMI
ncbi:MAG: PHP domain-containing protein [Candidatus Bathyarchaeota archaeon]|nr:PHP domain-containing protein [Candidatus Bathyarchaeota archaeon]